MKNKILIIVISSLIGSLYTHAQNKTTLDDLSSVSIMPIVADSEELSLSVSKTILNKMNQIVSYYGFSSYSSKFILFPKITKVSESITATAPPMHSYSLELTFYIADNDSKTIFSSVTLDLKGVGKSPSKAYISALKRVNKKHSEIEAFIEGGKNKIIDYYNYQCDFILNKAKTLAQQREFEHSISVLVEVPTVCNDCYFKSNDLIVEVYKQKLEYECSQLISNANISIAKGDYENAANQLYNILPDVSCYIESQQLLKQITDHQCALFLGKAKGAWSSGDLNMAASYLSQIPTESQCADEANQLVANIKNETSKKEERDWDFQLKQQQDIVDIQKARINTIRQIGVAYGENQQPSTTNWISRY